MGKRQIFIDTETTGLSPRQGHRIVEIAALETMSGRATERVFHIYLDPERDIDPRAMQVHGLSREFLTGKPTFSAIADDFINFIRDAELIIHNAKFDVAFIDEEFKRSGLPYRLNDLGNVLCSMQLAKNLFPGESASLDALIERLGLNITRDKHSALEDVELLSQVFFRMTAI